MAGAPDSSKDIFNKVLFPDKAGRLTEQCFVLHCKCDMPKLISICFLFVFCHMQDTLWDLAVCLTLMKFSLHFLVYFLISVNVSYSEVLGGKIAWLDF